MTSTSFQAIILAAGKGKRMRSALPKVLHRVCGKSLIARTLEAVAGLSPRKISVVVGYGEDLVRAEVEQLSELELFRNIEVACIRQAEQKGTGDAAKYGLSILDAAIEPVLIVPGDTPLLRTETLAPLLDASQNDVSILSSVPPDPFGYGRIIRDATGNVTAVIEEKDCSVEQRAVTETNTSIYLAKFSFLERALAALDTDNAQGELYLTDIVGVASSSGGTVGAVSAPNCYHVLGANTRAELAELESRRRSEINRELMLAGVTLQDPATTYVDEGVEVGEESFLAAGTKLLGKTRLGRAVVFDGNAYVIDSSIGDEVHVKHSCSVESSVVGNQCTIGPFAHLRPGTELADEVHIGNYVETKKSQIKFGAKVNHLTYIGDATVGAGANVGAGTITCNYDGFKKSRTVIGEGAFIGSNTSLVAPVTIGDRAVTGAGSVITKDVAPDALALERHDQTVVEGWAKRAREKNKKK